MNIYLFPQVLWHYWLGDRKGIWPFKNLCHLSLEVPLLEQVEENLGGWANPGPPGKQPLKQNGRHGGDGYLQWPLFICHFGGLGLCIEPKLNISVLEWRFWVHIGSNSTVHFSAYTEYYKYAHSFTVYFLANLGASAVSTGTIAHDVCTTLLKTEIINK